MRWFLLACLLAGCRKTPAERACAEFTNRLEDCGLGLISDDVDQHCRVSLPLSPEPDSATPSLSELERRAFAECVQVTDCNDMLECFKRNGCLFLMTSPADRHPKLSCAGAATRSP